MSQTPIALNVPTPIAGVEAPESRVVVARQWQLIWWKFRKHRLAVLGGIITILIYLVAILAEFLAPFATDTYGSRYTYAPPQPLHFIDQSGGGFKIYPYVNGYKVMVDYAAGRRNFEIDPSVKYPIGLFVHGISYNLLGIFPTDIHLIGPLQADTPMYLLGADHLGRDMLSRTIYGTRISVTIGSGRRYAQSVLWDFAGRHFGLFWRTDRQR